MMKKLLIALLFPLYAQAIDVQPRAHGQVMLQAVEINPETEESKPVGNLLVVDRAVAEKSEYIKNFLTSGLYENADNMPVVKLKVEPEQLEPLVEFLTTIAEYQAAPTRAQAEKPEGLDEQIARVLQEKIKEFDVEELSSLWLFADYLIITPLQQAVVYELAERLNDVSSRQASQNILKVMQDIFDQRYSEVARSIAQKIIELNPQEFSEWRLLRTLQGHTDWVRSAVFNHDGTRIVTASLDRTAKLWDATTGQLLHTLQGYTGPVRSAVLNHDGSRIVTASLDRTAKVWDATTGQLLHTLQGHTNHLLSAVFNHDGMRIVTASLDRTAKLWDATTGQLLHTLQGHTSLVNSAVFNHDGTRILTASEDRTARLWDATTGQLLHTLQGHTNEVTSAVFNHDGTRIVTASKDLTAKLWDATTGQLLHTLRGHTHWVKSAVFNHDSTRILTASNDSTAMLWDATTGQLLHTLQGHIDGVSSAVFNYDGTRIVTASYDNTAKLWQPINSAQANKDAGLVLQPEEVLEALQQLRATITDDAKSKILNNLLTLVRERGV